MLQESRAPFPSKILDVACGHGRHAALLSQQGHDVAATDISETLIAYRRDTQGEAIRFEKRSFAELDYGPTFDLVIVLGNSLSLIPREQLATALDNLTNCLKNDARLFIELDNRPYFVQQYAGRRHWDFHGGRWLRLSQYHYDDENKLEKTRDVSLDFRNMTVDRFQMTKSLYDYTEIAHWIAGAGMTIANAWGDWDGSDVSEASPSLLIVAQKKA
jgi:SAM-dependent methyltransferase